jgi:hypothetical protein
MNDSTRIFEFIMRAQDCLRHGSMENRTAGFLPDCTIILCRQAELLIAARAFVVDGIIRTWWFEPALSTVCFAIFIHWYGRHEQHHNGVVVRRTTSSPTSSWTQNPIVQATVAYWIGIYLWTRIIPPAADFIPDGIPIHWNDGLYLTMEVASGIVCYDAIFFLVHWAMHEIPCLRSWHARHHEQSATRSSRSSSSSRPNGSVTTAAVQARDTVRHSLIDGSLQVLVNILVQRHTVWGRVKTRLARALHNVIVIWMLTESHSAAPTPCIWRRWCTGMQLHGQHHHHHHHSPSPPLQPHQSRSRAYAATMALDNDPRMRYQQFFGYLDALRFILLCRQPPTEKSL